MTRMLLLALALVVAGCAQTAAQSPGPAATEARVGLTEWEVTTSASALSEGPVTLAVTNAGATAHNLVLSDEGGRDRTPLLAPGEQTSITVDLTGQREAVLWCDLPGHRAQGMERVLPVAG
ncbi:MAG: plastocyanin/azurin family copper-binding protein [Actinomycetota bacterium]|nr:plastocyanin/azurin family copper-binding protein [Actinomycetota bacterium]